MGMQDDLPSGFNHFDRDHLLTRKVARIQLGMQQYLIVLGYNRRRQAIIDLKNDNVIKVV